MNTQEVIKQLDLLICNEKVLIGCSTMGELQHSQNIEALEVAKRVVEESEVKHGEWISTKAKNIWEEEISVFLCSECKEYRTGVKGITKKLPYCPNCGARMDGDG